jgi:putative membrane protein
VSDDGDEPDYRYTLANERTLLAWIRTAIGLLAGGIAIEQLAPRFAVGWARTAIALVCVLLALFVLLRSYARWRAVDGAMRAGAPLPRNTTFAVLTSVLAIIAVLVGVLLLLG